MTVINSLPAALSDNVLGGMVTADLDDKVEALPNESGPVSAFVNLTKWQATKIFWRATLLCFFGGLCVLMEGYQGQITGSIVSNTGFIAQFGTTVASTGQKALNAEYVSAWGGTSGAFQMMGQQISTLIADRYGRTTSFYIATVLIIAGVFMEQFVTTIAGWLGAKIVAGFAAGMGQATSLLSNGASYGLFLAIGQLISAIALQIVNVTDANNWRRAIYSEWVIIGLWLMCLPWVYETPWYYARKGLHENAKAALGKIFRGVKGYEFEHEYRVMQLQLEHEDSTRRSQKDSTFQEIFQGTNLRRTLASFFGVVLLQWSGASVVFSGLLVFMVLVSFYLTERFGRRSLLLTGGTGCFVCNIILGTLGVVKRTDAVLHATLAVICIWVLFYAGCLAGVGWGLTSEIATPRLRARTAGVVINGSQSFSLMFGYTVPLMLASTGSGARNWGVKTLYLFACTGGIGLVINYFILPEVRGRSFAELDEMFEARISPRRMKSHVTEVERSGAKDRE
ncbi:hypothetical protein JCM24511_07053 [Saitozyma sp. JCM 24511]|nr:hypothetical protein JCM24511_07053 [Saitozyma sp. JCM 24511]